jgi:hypothetical protein
LRVFLKRFTSVGDFNVRTHLRTYKSEQKPGGEWLSIIAVGGCGCEYHRRRRVREPQDLVG